MIITKTKLENPYSIALDLSISNNDSIAGTISIDGTEYVLEVLSQDIIDCLVKMIGKGLLSLFPENYNIIIPDTVDDIPETFRKNALEVKLELMACIDFEGMNDSNKARLEVFREYHRRENDEDVRHSHKLANIIKWLDDELKRWQL